VSGVGVVSRFAPSPTGYLHLGHALSAWTAWRRARESGGRFVLRLEDIDLGRCRPAFAEAIMEDLRWLGLDWDGPVRVQSTHFDDYRGVLEELAHRALIYPCFCSRAEVAREAAGSVAAPHGPDGGVLYPGTCRGLGAADRAARLAAGAPHVWRLDMVAALAGAPPLTFLDEDLGEVTARPERFGDVVLGRRDVPASYHLCVTHDDALQGVTHVIRGEDLREATHLHRLLQHLMGWDVPRYAFHRLLLGADGRRLSKRDGAVSLRALRAGGMTAEEVQKVLF
jgi:glutamyl-Q tRNA(Asp) synthetase